MIGWLAAVLLATSVLGAPTSARSAPEPLAGRVVVLDPDRLVGLPPSPT
jgi:hypothetical protein